MYSSKIFQVICLRIFLFIMIYKYDIFEFISYIVYNREPSKIRGNRTESIGREYDQVSQIIEKKFYL